MGLYNYVVIDAKTYADQHSLPNIQDILDSLRVNVFFSVLDQSKAYHRLHMDKESRGLISSAIHWDSVSGNVCLLD